MQNVHLTVRQFVAPFAPPPATPEEIEALRVRADLALKSSRPNPLPSYRQGKPLSLPSCHAQGFAHLAWAFLLP